MTSPEGLTPGYTATDEERKALFPRVLAALNIDEGSDAAEVTRAKLMEADVEGFQTFAGLVEASEEQASLVEGAPVAGTGMEQTTRNLYGNVGGFDLASELGDEGFDPYQ